MKVAIYAGPGASELSVRLKTTWFSSLGVHPVRVGPRDITDGLLSQDFQLFVLPGGESRGFHLALNGKGFEAILAYWCGGGKVWGSCAGAYYLSRNCHYNDSNLQVHRELPEAIFQGTATGPYHKGLMGVAGVSVQLAWADGTLSRSRCFRDPIFTNLGPHDTALFTYPERQNSVGGVLCRNSSGSGLALLTSCHPEMAWCDGIEAMIPFWGGPPPDWRQGWETTKRKLWNVLSQ